MTTRERINQVLNKHAAFVNKYSTEGDVFKVARNADDELKKIGIKTDAVELYYAVKEYWLNEKKKISQEK